MPNDRVEARHYAFLVFLTLLNVMNFVDGSYWRALPISSCRTWG